MGHVVHEQIDNQITCTLVIQLTLDFVTPYIFPFAAVAVHAYVCGVFRLDFSPF